MKSFIEQRPLLTNITKSNIQPRTREALKLLGLMATGMTGRNRLPYTIFYICLPSGM